MSELSPLPGGLAQRVHTLIEIADLLGANDVTFLSMSSAIDKLSDEELALRLSNNRLGLIEKELEANLALASHEYQLMKNWEEKIQAELSSSDSPANLERRREALIRKAKEYHRELEETTAAVNDKPVVTISQLLGQHQENAKKEKDLKAKRAKLEAFRGLPSNLDLAKHELLQAQQEQMKLIQLRERLLGSMADNLC